MKKTINFSFRRAVPIDAAEIASLLNSAYRGESSKEGWTTEADLVGGERTNSGDILGLIGEEGNHFILAMDKDTILGCVHVREEDKDTIYFGMLAVRPKLQAFGIGSGLIRQVQEHAEATGRKRIRISVINFRKELISYYARLGFEATGLSEDFPNQKDIKVQGIELLEFVKVLHRKEI